MTPKKPSQVELVKTWSILALDILVVIIKIVVSMLYGIYRFFDPPEETPVAGEIVFITGTGHGIGKELAKQYAQLGAEVVCVDINNETNNSTRDELKKQGLKVHAYSCDVSNRDEVLKLAERVKSEVGDVTIIVNSAGIMSNKRLLDHNPEEIRRMFDINVFAHLWIFEAFLPRMMDKNRGHVVAISSIAGLWGFANIVPYCASKYAVRGLMDGAAEEFRQEGRSIKFTTIYPTVTDTGLCKKPFVRFPLILGIVRAADVAREIISAQRRGYTHVSIQSHWVPFTSLIRLLPDKTQNIISSFLGGGLDVPEDNYEYSPEKYEAQIESMLQPRSRK